MSDRFHMDRAEEVDYAQERARQEPAPVEPKPAPPTATTPAVAAPAAVRRDPFALVAALAGLALVLAFFYPAFHDAFDRGHRILPLARDGRAEPAAPAPKRAAMTVVVDATPRGATVVIDGLEGSSPFATNLVCVDGATIAVSVTAKGYAEQHADLPCRPGGHVDLSPVLQRVR